MTSRMRTHLSLVVIPFILLSGCTVGWKNIERKKQLQGPVQFVDLSNDVQSFIKYAVTSPTNKPVVSNDTISYKVIEYFVISGDYEALTLRKMGHYIDVQSQRLYLEFKKGTPFILHNGVLYYTKGLNLSKGINQQDDWLNEYYFFSYKLK